jgi:hypothetical protein
MHCVSPASASGLLLGDIAWSLAELGKMFEKAQAAQGMLIDRLRASSEDPLSQVRPKL